MKKGVSGSSLKLLFLFKLFDGKSCFPLGNQERRETTCVLCITSFVLTAPWDRPDNQEPSSPDAPSHRDNHHNAMHPWPIK